MCAGVLGFVGLCLFVDLLLVGVRLFVCVGVASLGGVC